MRLFFSLRRVVHELILWRDSSTRDGFPLSDLVVTIALMVAYRLGLKGTVRYSPPCSNCDVSLVITTGSRFGRV